MTRTAFLVDGFNLYHSLRAASLSLGGVGTRWLDLLAFCRSLLSLVGDQAELESVTYFSALARHLEARAPDTVMRHEAYLACLMDTGVRVELSHFKAKLVHCPECAARITRHEEKETDVAMASRLFELLQTDRCDAVAVVTGDSDLAPAMRTAARLFPTRRVISILPFHRVSRELRQVSSAHYKVSAAHYARSQFPDPFITRAGRPIAKPHGW